MTCGVLSPCSLELAAAILRCAKKVAVNCNFVLERNHENQFETKVAWRGCVLPHHVSSERIL